MDGGERDAGEAPGEAGESGPRSESQAIPAPPPSPFFRRLVFAQSLAWVVAQLAGALLTGKLAPFLLAIWAATLARESRRPDPRAPRRVQVRLAWLNALFVLFGVVPIVAGKAKGPDGGAGMAFGVLFAMLFVLHLVAWRLAPGEDE